MSRQTCFSIRENQSQDQKKQPKMYLEKMNQKQPMITTKPSKNAPILTAKFQYGTQISKMKQGSFDIT